MTREAEAPLVGIIMGSRSDWETMRHAAETLERLGVPYETRVVSAHRTPQRLYDYAQGARGRGLQVIVAVAAGSSAMTICKIVMPMNASLPQMPVSSIHARNFSGSDANFTSGIPANTLMSTMTATAMTIAAMPSAFCCFRVSSFFCFFCFITPLPCHPDAHSIAHFSTFGAVRNCEEI